MLLFLLFCSGRHFSSSRSGLSGARGVLHPTMESIRGLRPAVLEVLLDIRPLCSVSHFYL